ncbi:segregation/condensation protein A [Candidatus Uhrbacteria bacterium]|nr:segregation/condensation protein A [Candidatus Uhrbacteria bacterium]
MPFEISTEQFSGPLHLLLEIVRENRLPITDVSLSQVTEEYLRYLDAHEVPSTEIADFLTVACALLLIKARALMPSVVMEDEPEGDLAARLRLYEQYIEASKNIENLFGAHSQTMFARDRMSLPKLSGFFPPPSVNPSKLSSCFQDILKRLEPFFALETRLVARVATVQERMEALRGAILGKAWMLFSDVVKGASRKVDVVVSFLALLELLRSRSVQAVQAGAFGEIEIKRVD